MASKMNPYKHSEASLQQAMEVRELWQSWDPIGVMGIPGAPQDEYDPYLDPTLRLLERDASVDEIEAYLEWVAYKRMGLPYVQLHAREFAQVLQMWYSERWMNVAISTPRATLTYDMVE
jgi:hypothetical protein